MTNFAMVLRMYRKNQGWSQSELAEYWSYSFETISAWERGKRFPSRTEIPRIAHFLEMDSEKLVAVVAASKGVPVKKGPPPLTSRGSSPAHSSTSHQPPSPFSQGRLLWTLHLGIENDALQCLISCPLSNGETWTVELDSEVDFEDIQYIYRVVQDQVAFKAGRQRNTVSAAGGKIVPLGLRSSG